MPKKVQEQQNSLEIQYVEVVRGVPEVFPTNNSYLLLEQPEKVVGQNFTTYSAGEIPAFLSLK